MYSCSRWFRPVGVVTALGVSASQTFTRHPVHSDDRHKFEKIHIHRPQQARATNIGVVKVVPIFPLGMSGIWPHSGTRHFHIFESRYQKLYLDMLGWAAVIRWPLLRTVQVSMSLSFGDSLGPSKPSLVALWMGVDKEGKYLSSFGVMLDVVSWSRIGILPPRYDASHRVGSRVRIRRIINPEAVSDLNAYFLAEIEVIDDEPSPAEHPVILEAWKAVWISLACLLDAQERLDAKPRLSKKTMLMGRDRSLSYPDRCWLSAQDIWRPAAMMQELYQAQIQVAHAEFVKSKVPAQLRDELERIARAMEQLQALLQASCTVDMCLNLEHSIYEEVRRIEDAASV